MTKSSLLVRRVPAPVGQPVPTANTVVLALVMAILELEQRRDRGMVATPMSRRRPE